MKDAGRPDQCSLNATAQLYSIANFEINVLEVWLEFIWYMLIYFLKNSF